MADTVTTLAIKDGTATASGLSAISSSTGYSTYHALTGTLANDVSSSLSLINAKSDNISSYTSNISTKINDVSSSLNYAGSSVALLASNISSSLNYSGYSAGRSLYDYTIPAANSSISTASYVDLTNGTAITSPALSTRKTLIFFNHTNGDVYMSIGSTLDVNNGLYTYVIASSGSYTSEHRYAGLVHYLTGSSGVTSGRVTITSLTKNA